jgi:hypothetical protein
MTPLFQLHNDGSIWEYTGTPFWKKLDDNRATTAITVSDFGILYQLHNDGSIWECPDVAIDPVEWTLIDSNTATTTIAGGSGTPLYQLHNDGSIWGYTGTPLTGWNKLDGNPATTAIAAAPFEPSSIH